MCPAPDSSDQARLTRRWSADHGEALALRVVSARQLGEVHAPDPLTVVSVKRPPAGPSGAAPATFWVSPQGAELATLEPSQLCGFRLDRLEALLAGDAGAAAVGELPLAALAPLPCDPPAATLLHAAVGAPYVDQTQPTAICALAANEDAAELIAAELGPETLFVPGHGASAVVLFRRRWEEHVARYGRPPEAMVDASGALFTFGDRPEACAARRAAVVARAERFVAAVGADAAGSEFRAPDRPEERMLLALAMRGGMQRASGRSWVARWSVDPAVLRLSEPRELGLLVDAGRWPSPEHTRLLGLLPLVFAGGAHADTSARAREIDETLERFAQGAEPPPAGAEPAPPLRSRFPRVVLVPGLGALCFGQTMRECRQRTAMLEHAARVLQAAARLGRYHPAAAARADGEAARATRSTRPRVPESAALPLAGRVVLLTGADSGIGVATTRALLQAGAHVVITAEDVRVAETIGDAHRERYPEQLVVTTCDVTSDQECQQAVRLACDRFGGLDVLISNAGMAPSGTLHSDGGDAALRLSLDVNLLAHQRAARSAAQVMLTQGSGGVLLFNASKSAFVQGPAFGPYAVPKAALVALMRQYAIDLGPAGIRSNAVNADRVHIKRALVADPRLPEEERELMPSEYFRANLLRRETTPESVAEAFVYLATAESTTGCVITVDGGNPGAFPR